MCFFLKGRHCFLFLLMSLVAYTCSVLVVVRILTGRLKSLKIFHDFSPSFVNKKD